MKENRFVYKQIATSAILLASFGIIIALIALYLFDDHDVIETQKIHIYSSYNLRPNSYTQSCFEDSFVVGINAKNTLICEKGFPVFNCVEKTSFAICSQVNSLGLQYNKSTCYCSFRLPRVWGAWSKESISKKYLSFENRTQKLHSVHDNKCILTTIACLKIGLLKKKDLKILTDFPQYSY